MPIRRSPCRARESAARREAPSQLVPREPRASRGAGRRRSPRSCDAGRSRAHAGLFRERCLQHPPDDAARVEVLLGKSSRRAAVALVIRLDQRQRANRLVHCPEANDTLRIRQIAAWTRVLDDRGLAAREKADGAVADPPARKLDIGWLRDAELTP